MEKEREREIEGEIEKERESMRQSEREKREPQCTLSLPFGPSEMSLGPEKSAAFLHRIDVWLSPSLQSFKFHAVDCVKWQQFTKVILSPCGYICSMARSVPSEGSNVMHIE